MPLKTKRSQQAPLQRASEKQGFDSEFVEDPFKKLLDPDYNPVKDEENIGDHEDGDEILMGDYAFSMTAHFTQGRI